MTSYNFWQHNSLILHTVHIIRQLNFLYLYY
nr:MAG TPA: hypothetical protein [Caudoviricetes sp.]